MKVQVGKDVFGHELLKDVSDNDTIYYLKLNNEDRTRNICTLRDGMVVIPRKRTVHEFRLLQAYGLSKLMLEDLPEKTIVSIRDESGVYNIPKEEVLRNSIIWSSSNPNFEEQLFIKLDKLEGFKS